MSLQGYYACNRMCFGKYRDSSEGTPPRHRGFADTLSLARKASQCPDPKSSANIHCGVTGRSALYDLEYYDPVRDNVLDMMHLTSGVVGRHLVKLLTGARLKQFVATEKKDQLRQKKRTIAQVHADDAASADRAAEKQRSDQNKANKAASASFQREKKAYKARGVAQDTARQVLVNAEQRKEVVHVRKAAAAGAAAAAESNQEHSEVS